MESIHSHAGFSYRTTDSWDDESRIEEHARALGNPDPDLSERRASSSKRKRSSPSDQFLVSRCEPKRLSMPSDSDIYQRLDSNLNQQVPTPSNPSASFDGSVEELDPLQEQSDNAPSLPKRARISQSHTNQGSRSWNLDTMYPPQISTHGEMQDQRVGVHSLAHEFLLRGMLADPELMGLGRPPGSSGSQLRGIRNALFPRESRLDNDSGPREHPYQLPNPETSTSPLVKERKKVHVVPPPIDITGRKSLAEEYVRTPYPFAAGRSYPKDLNRDLLSTSASPAGATESILTLTIRKLNPNSRTRITAIKIPASNDYSAVRNTQAGEKSNHLKPAAFDDEQFFLQLRQCYIDLAGPGRFFLARTLTRIAVSGPATRAADARYPWIHKPGCSQLLAYKGLADTFSEEKILQLYSKSSLGKSRYAFVQWAHQLAAAPASNSPLPREDESMHLRSSDVTHRAEMPEGLEFVVSWSIARILFALMAAIVLSIVAALLWTFLGKNAIPQLQMQQGGGFLDAGDRVGTGVLLGICVFLICSGGIAGWLGVSWLVM